MSNLQTIFRAGFVRRWHANPDLCHTGDRLDGHHARVARIILALHPDPSVALLKAALTHDDGESVTGDIPAPAKDGDSAAEHSARCDIWGDDCFAKLDVIELRWLKFADKLDAYMWAKHHAPHSMDIDEWRAARVWVLCSAIAIEVLDEVEGALGL
jgi:hypothetical protein